MNALGKASASSTGSKGSAFRKPSYKRSLAILSTSGIVFGLGLSGSSQAIANPTADCLGNTVTPASTGTQEGNEVQNLLNIYNELREDNGVVCLSGHFDLDGRVFFNRNVKVYGLGTSSITSPYGTVFQSDTDIDENSLSYIAYDIEISNLSILNSPGTAIHARNVDIRNGSTLSGNDGAIRAERNVTISNSTLSANEVSDGDGGAIYALGNVTISANSTLSNNVAIDGDGGAIFAEGNVTISNSTLSNNVAIAGNGGAILADGNVTISNSTLSGNSARYGGAISALGVVSISNGSTLSSNSANEHGGAIESGGTVSISSASTLSLNTAGTNGAAIFAYNQGGVTVSNSTLFENDAVSNGGGIWSDGAVTVSSNSTLLDNTAYRGGAIEAGLDVTVSNSTLSENSSSSQGGAIFGIDAVTVSNSTFSGNLAGTDGGAIFADGEGDVNISGSTLSNNLADRSGGALFSLGVANISNSSLSNNRADDDENGEGNGGAVDADQNLSVFNTTFSGNSAVYGGAVSGSRSLTFENGTLSDNSAVSGGSIYSFNQSYSISLSSSTLNNNDAVTEGGAVFSSGSLNVSSSTLSGNETTTGRGGALSVNGSSTIENSTLNNNDAVTEGGAVFSSGSLNVSSSTLSGNTTSGAGGAIYVNGISTVENSTFSSNFAEQGGGGAIWGYGTITATKSTFSTNRAFEGGAIYGFRNTVFEDGGRVEVRNSTFLRNEAYTPASEGGAISAYEGEVMFSTFVNNIASTGIGGIRGDSIKKTGAGDFEIGANIFAGDTTRAQLGIGASPTPFTDLGGNVFSTSSSQESDIVQDPLDYPDDRSKDVSTSFDKSLLSLFGSSTPSLTTYAPNSSGTQTLGLAAGSPALNVVPNRTPFDTNTFAQDQRGATRSFPASAGSFEGVAPVTPPPTPPPTSTTTPTPASNTAPTAPPSTLAKTGIEIPLWLGIAAGLVTALGSIAAGLSSKLRRRPE